jgi:FPC/CPF motif-containing protein YcgG
MKRLFTRREQPALTTRRWFVDVGNLERLRAILADPTFIAATNIITTEAALSGTVVFRDPERLQLYAAYNAGINDFLTRLEQLAVAPVERDIPAEWDHISTETTDL